MTSLAGQDWPILPALAGQDWIILPGHDQIQNGSGGSIGNCTNPLKLKRVDQIEFSLVFDETQKILYYETASTEHFKLG